MRCCSTLSTDPAGGLDVRLQTKPQFFSGHVLICDTTIFSSMVGGLDSLRRFWRNVVTRERRAGP
jgi:hypothetical protein